MINIAYVWMQSVMNLLRMLRWICFREVEGTTSQNEFQSSHHQSSFGDVYRNIFLNTKKKPLHPLVPHSVVVLVEQVAVTHIPGKPTCGVQLKPSTLWEIGQLLYVIFISFRGIHHNV